MNVVDRIFHDIALHGIDSVIKNKDFYKNYKPIELSQHDVSGRSELLFDFIAEIKLEFSDQNWDYLDFIADRVIGKQ